MKTILIASDHAGFEMKEILKKNASALQIQFDDLGTHSTESVDYPDFANTLCKKLLTQGEGSLGILICGSGVGVSIAANRFHGIRAVLAESAETAKLGREHNHANVLCLGARFLNEAKALEIVRAFLLAEPDMGERHSRRVHKLD
jgi:ribose 5-phosphate isomerase B